MPLVCATEPAASTFNRKRKAEEPSELTELPLPLLRDAGEPADTTRPTLPPIWRILEHQQVSSSKRLPSSSLGFPPRFVCLTLT